MLFGFGCVFKHFLRLRDAEMRNRPNIRDNGLDDDDDSNYRDEDIFDLFESFDRHRYFEQQLDEIFRMFGNTIMEPPFSHGNFNNSVEDEQQPQRSIREEFFKPGFQTEEQNKDNTKDSDLDGMIAPQDLDKFMFKNVAPESNIKFLTPFNPQLNFFGRTVITRTIIKPDGTQETRRTVRDSRTNEEETTVTITQRDNSQIDPKLNPPSDGDLWEKFFGNK